MNNLKEAVKRFWKDEKGLGTLEILLIVAVLIGIALLFRGQIIAWVQTLLESIGGEIDSFDPNDIPSGNESETNNQSEPASANG